MIDWTGLCELFGAIWAVLEERRHHPTKPTFWEIKVLGACVGFLISVPLLLRPLKPRYPGENTDLLERPAADRGRKSLPDPDEKRN